MAVLSDPSLPRQLERYGAQDVVKCYQCGMCTAVCPFAAEPFLFPRRFMRYLQAGLTDKIRGSLEPWLCYYCGECSEECPRGAEPGETMMSMRRWLTAQYDWTGLSSLFYRSWKFELFAIAVVGLLTALGFALFGSLQGDLRVYDGPGAFLPSSAVHVFDWILGGTLAALLLSNCARMWWFSIGRRHLDVPAGAYLRNAWLLPFHFLTQRRYQQCERKRPWAVHLVLALSYVTMLVLIMFFLEAMQRGPEISWPHHLPGYAATAGLLGATLYAISGRLRRSETHYKHSHETDWIFLGMLVYVALTGIVQHALHRSGLEPAANVLYVAHMAGVVPMLALEVPFSKWSHMAYRPLAMYFAALRVAAAVARPAAVKARPQTA